MIKKATVTKLKPAKRVAVAAPRCNSPVEGGGGVPPLVPVISVAVPEPLVKFRAYQLPIFLNRTDRVVILHWSRQIGKSFTLAAWAIDRLLTRPGRLITVLSNSRDNGAEFLRKCEEICNKMRLVMEWKDETDALTPDDLKITTLRMEARVQFGGHEGRIKVLAANPRTARGFSGDLILDEFAFHEDSQAIWEAAEPILSSDPDFLCRIASTGNGKQNMFYRMVTSGLYKVSRVRRSDAYAMGVKIHDPSSNTPITPEQARARSLDKAAYDQNYECAFANEMACLILGEMINAAENDQVGFVCEQDWTSEAIERMRACEGGLNIGVDVARTRDFTVITALETISDMHFARAILRIQDMSTPNQQTRLDDVLRMPKFRQCSIDATGLGLGLYEYAARDHGHLRINGVNFSTTVPMTDEIAREGHKQLRVKVTEAMAMHTAQVFEDRRIQVPRDQIWRDDMRKPTRIVSPGGSRSIAATREGSPGHADHFWSLALALDAASGNASSWTAEDIDAVVIPVRRSAIMRPCLS